MKYFLPLVVLAFIAMTPHALAQAFHPLTTLPAVADASNTAGLTAFLNQLYKICTGAAALLALLQIVRGGVTYMMSDTGVYEKRQARHHIELALLGLVLVLSPALVFGIIDPKILDLNVDVSPLTPTSSGAGADTATGGTPDNQNISTNPNSCAPITPNTLIGEGQVACCNQQKSCQATTPFGASPGQYQCTCSGN